MTDEPILKRRATNRPAPSSVGAWRVRVALAALFFFASEVLLWTEISRPTLEWAALTVGYVAVAALLLDLLVRARVVELFGALVLAGSYGLLAGTLLNPGVALADLPVSLVTRVMGAQTAAGAVGLALFLGLLGGVGRVSLWIAALAGGAFWGMWASGYPLLLGLPPVDLPVAISVVASGAVLVVIAALMLRGENIALLDRFRLSGVEYGGVLIVVGGLLALGLLRGDISRDAISYVVTLLFFCGMILWFQHRTGRTRTLLTERGIPPNLMTVAIAAAIFGGAGALTYAFAPPVTGDGLDAFGTLSLAFGAFGLAWLPAVCVVLGVRAYRETARTGKSL